jgi:hypothetical protein
MAAPITTEKQLDTLKAVLSEDKLFQRALGDCVELLLRRTIIGLSIPDATVALDLLRQQLEKANRP